MANRTRALVSVIFNFAIEREIVEYSPVIGVRRPAAERRRDRVLSEEEIRKLWAGKRWSWSISPSRGCSDSCC